MKEIRRYELGESGTDWVRRSLDIGGVIGSTFLRTRDPREGHAITFVPARSAQAARDALDGGGLFESSEEAETARTAAIRDFAAAAGDGWIVVEGHRWVPESERVRREPERVLVANGNAYWWQRLNGAGELREFLRRVEPGYPTNVFAVPPPVPALSPLHVLSSDEVNSLVRAVRALLVGAYDEESYVVWTPA